MANYRIHRLKDSVRQQFRWAPHTIGITTIKPKDYEPFTTVEALTPYAVWMQLKDSDTPLEIGDVLELESGEVRIYKYVGFEQAQWLLPEVKSPAEGSGTATGQQAAG